jgi:hypothetical protein
MRLTWKDAITTLSAGAAVAACTAYANGTSLWLISSARGATAVVLLLGIVGCSFSEATSMYATAQPQSVQMFRLVSTTLGAAALIAAVAGLITGSGYALAMLATATIALWLVATVRHLLTVPPRTVNGRDVHEVIHPEKAALR